MNSMSFVIQFWHWWVLAVAFFALELAAPGAFLLWLGFSATLTGFSCWAFPSLNELQQLLLFGGFSFINLVIWHRYFRGYRPASSQPHLNDRGAQLLGTTHFLTDAMKHGTSTLKINDSYWRITGPDLPKGTRIKIVDVDGIVLKVEEIQEKD